MQCLHSLAPLLQSLGRGKNIPRGTFCAAGRIGAASGSHRQWRDGAWARFWSREHPGARRGLGGEGRRTLAARGGHSRQRALLRQTGAAGRWAVQAHGSDSLAGRRHSPGSPETQRRLHRAIVPCGHLWASWHHSLAPRHEALRRRWQQRCLAMAGEEQGGTKRRGRDPQQAQHFGAAAEEL